MRWEGLKSSLMFTYHISFKYPVEKWKNLQTYIDKYKYKCIIYNHIHLQKLISGSPFYLTMAQSKCLMPIRKNSGLNTLCHSCGFESAKNFSYPWLSPLRGWGSLTMTFSDNLHISFRSSRKLSSYLVRANLYPLERTVGSRK